VVPLPVRRRENLPQSRELWDPLREIADLQQRMSQLMESVWPTAALSEVAWSPLVDIEEIEDAWLVEADLPGVKKGDVNVEVSDSELTISGEIKERERKGVLRRRTRRTGQFEYRVTLPGDADTEHIDASLNEGVLTVRIPKPERAKPRRIEVRSGG
jgi:HSP20 family protein